MQKREEKDLRTREDSDSIVQKQEDGNSGFPMLPSVRPK